MNVSSPLFKINPHLAAEYAAGGVDGGGSAVVFSKTNSYSVPLLRVLVHSAFHMMLIVQHSAAISACTNNELGK